MASGDLNELLSTLKAVLNDVLETKKLTKSTIGTITAINPVTVKISQKISIKEPMVIVPRHLTDYETKLTVNYATGSEISGSTSSACSDCPHIHEIKRLSLFETKAMIHNALKIGEKVHLIQNHGGREYIILDRVVN